MSQLDYKYWAFISYSHRDRKWAEWLHRALETYTVPRRLVGRETALGVLPRRLFPIFRDREELPSSAELGGVIEQALRQSRYLIVICSPQSARSRWVNEEIRVFKAMGRASRVMALIVDGEPDTADPTLECFPRALREGAGGDAAAEPIAADARREGDGRSGALLKLLAGLMSIGLDELRRRERQRQLQRRVAWSGGLAAALVAVAGLLALQQRRYDARDQAALVARLIESGREELLAGQQMRAAAYLSKAYELGSNSPALRFMLKQAMQPIDALERVIDNGSSVWKMQLSRDDQRMFTLSHDGVLRTWEIEQGVLLSEIPALDSSKLSTYCVPWFSDDGRIAIVGGIEAGSGNMVLSAWSLTDRRRLATATVAPTACAAARPINPDGTEWVTAALDGRVTFYRLEDGQTRFIGNGLATTASFSPDGRLVVAGQANGDVLVWDTASGRLERRLDGLDEPIRAIEFDPAGNILVAAAASGALRGWSLLDGRVTVAGGHSQRVNRIDIATSAPRLLTMGDDGIRVWHIGNGTLAYAAPSGASRVATPLSADGRLLGMGDGHGFTALDIASSMVLYRLDAPATTAEFSTDGSRLFTTGGSSIRIWNNRFRPLATTATTEVAGKPPPWYSPSVYFAQLPGGQLISGGADGVLRLWTSRDLQSAGSLGELGAAITAVVASADHTRVAASTVEGSIGIWERASGRLLHRLEIPGQFISVLLISPDGRHVFAADRTDAGYLWRVDDEQPLARYQLDSRYAADFSPDATRLAIASGRNVTVIDLSSLQPQMQEGLAPGAQGRNPPIGCLRFAPDSASLVAMSDDASGIARWFSLRDSARTDATLPKAAGCFGASFDAAGERVLFVQGGAAASIWNLRRGLSLRLGEHAGIVYDAAWSPDGRFVVTGGSEGRGKVWEADSGKPLQDLVLHADEISAIAYARDGATIYSGSADGHLTAWDASMETRAAVELAARLDCVSPWEIQGAELSSRTPESRCL